MAYERCYNCNDLFDSEWYGQVYCSDECKDYVHCCLRPEKPQHPQPRKKPATLSVRTAYEQWGDAEAEFNMHQAARDRCYRPPIV